MIVYFWAQGLDNQSDIFGDKDGHQLLEASRLTGTEIISSIKKVASEKSKQNDLSSDDITIYNSGLEYVVQVIPEKRDIANRLSPIIIYGRFSEESEDVGIESSAVKKFAEVSGRWLSENTIEDISSRLGDLGKKKSRTRVLASLLQVIVITLILPLSLGIILQKYLLQSPLIITLFLSVNNVLILFIRELKIFRVDPILQSFAKVMSKNSKKK